VEGNATNAADKMRTYNMFHTCNSHLELVHKVAHPLHSFFVHLDCMGSALSDMPQATGGIASAEHRTIIGPEYVSAKLSRLA
jgi:hypothetical protein